MKDNSIKKLLEDIVRKQLTQQLKEDTGSDLNFKTIIQMDNSRNRGNISTYYESTFFPDLLPNDTTLESSELTIEWGIQIDARNWGIKDININITNIYGTLLFQTYRSDDVNGDNPLEIEKEFKLTPEWKVESDIKLSSSSIFPSNVEIDFKNKTITVESPANNEY